MTTKRGGGTTAAPAPAIDDDEDGQDPVPDGVAADPQPVVPQAVAWHASAPRQGEPGQVYHLGSLSVTADADGAIRPATPEDVQVVDAHRLPVIHQTED